MYHISGKDTYPKSDKVTSSQGSQFVHMYHISGKDTYPKSDKVTSSQGSQFVQMYLFFFFFFGGGGGGGLCPVRGTGALDGLFLAP